MFSEAPGTYSPNIQLLAKGGDLRGNEKLMADLYLKRESHAYGNGYVGEQQRPAFESNVVRLDGALMPRSTAVNGLLDNPAPAAYLAGFNLAKKSLTGNEIGLYISDLREDGKPILRSAAETLQTELRSRYFNPAWIRSMVGHGYDGARHLMVMTDNLDLWDSAATQVVTSADWSEVKSVYVDDKHKLGLDKFFDSANPWAQQIVLANLLGAARRGNWDATDAELTRIARRLVESTVAHGSVCGPSLCGDQGMTSFIAKSLKGQADAAPLMESYQAQLSKAMAAQPSGATAAAAPSQAAPAGAPAPADNAVTGKVLETAPPTNSQAIERGANALLWMVSIGVVVLLFGSGWVAAGRTELRI